MNEFAETESKVRATGRQEADDAGNDRHEQDKKETNRILYDLKSDASVKSTLALL